MEDYSKLIPEQETGVENDNESELVCRNDQEAKAFFKELKLRLLNVNEWKNYAGKGTAVFFLTDENGNRVERFAKKGDHFCIDIPGPGSVTGEGYDWVRIEEVNETIQANSEYFAVLVRPASNPKNNDSDVAHFFADEATSSFVVSREGNILKAEVHGRNEKPNTSTAKIIDKARNAAVATGAISGFAKYQWKSLINGWLKFEKDSGAGK
jgi:hypothetical protein